MQLSENVEIRIVLDWKSEGKIPRGCLRKRWIKIIKKSLKDLEVQNWGKIVQDRDKFNGLLIKTLGEQ